MARQPRADAGLPTREAFLAEAHRRWKSIADAEAQLRRRMLEDWRFKDGDPNTVWGETAVKARADDSRPCLIIDRLSQPIKQVTNQQRETRPAVRISPIDDRADIKTAEVLQGLIRHIETTSEADTAYDTACEHQVTLGRGWWYVLPEYCAVGDYQAPNQAPNPTQFEQKLRIVAVDNPFSVYLDANKDKARGPQFGFIVDDVPRADYERRYPESRATGLTDYSSVGDDLKDWVDDQHVRIALYFYNEPERVAIALVQVGDQIRAVPGDQVPKGAQVLHRRTLEIPHIKWATINALEVLEGNDARNGGADWPGQYIPIVEVAGEETWIDGQRDLKGMVRMAKGPCRAYDFWVTALTEAIGQVPNAPVIGAAGQFEGFEDKWNTANVRRYPYLEYNAVLDGLPPGTVIQPPGRPQYTPDIAAIVRAIQQADIDIKAVLGYFDASQERSPEQSGKAILARQKQGDIGNSNFIDNLGRAIRYTGRILVDLAPKIYDTPRVMRLRGTEDQDERTVLVGASEQIAGMGAPPQGAEIDGIYQLDVGTYDVAVNVGPSYQSRRQESVEAMQALISANPAIFPLIGHLWVKNMDWPGAEEAADILKQAAIKAGAIQPDDQKGQPEIPPALMAQMQQAQQVIDALSKELNAKNQVIESEQQRIEAEERIKRLEIEGRLRVEELKIRAQLVTEQMKVAQQAEAQTISAELKELELKLDALVTGTKLDAQAQDAEKARQAAAEAHDLDLQDAQAARDTDGTERQMDRQAQMDMAAMKPPATGASAPA